VPVRPGAANLLCSRGLAVQPACTWHEKRAFFRHKRGRSGMGRRAGGRSALHPRSKRTLSGSKRGNMARVCACVCARVCASSAPAKGHPVPYVRTYGCAPLPACLPACLRASDPLLARERRLNPTWRCAGWLLCHKRQREGAHRTGAHGQQPRVCVQKEPALQVLVRGGNQVRAGPGSDMGVPARSLRC